MYARPIKSQLSPAYARLSRKHHGEPLFVPGKEKGNAVGVGMSRKKRAGKNYREKQQGVEE